MEICRMDNTSHFYPGISQRNVLNSNYEFGDEHRNESDASTSYAFNKDQSRNAYQEYQKLDSDNWKSENVECKQENESTSFMNNSSLNDNSNYGSESEFNEPYQYAYNQISPLYTSDTATSSIAPGQHILPKNNVQSHRMGPYHISSTKNQLPSWYNPPSTYFNTQQPGFFQHQYPYHQETCMGVQPTAASGDHKMRNMIQLTSRYYCLFVADSSKDCKLLCEFPTICVKLRACHVTFRSLFTHPKHWNVWQ